MSTKYDYSIEEVLEMCQTLDNLINQDSSFDEILTKKIKEGKMVFSELQNGLMN